MLQEVRIHGLKDRLPRRRGALEEHPKLLVSFFEILMILIYFNAIAFTLNALSFPKNLRAIHVGEAS